MTIYIDSLRKYQNSPLRNKWWCHMATDGKIEELHVMAKTIGMRRSWFQDHPLHPHYDLTKTRRLAAIKNGAVEVSVREFVIKCSKLFNER